MELVNNDSYKEYNNDLQGFVFSERKFRTLTGNWRLLLTDSSPCDYISIKKKSSAGALLFVDAEEEGFEPPVPFSTSVFKTGALNRSAIPP